MRILRTLGDPEEETGDRSERRTLAGLVGSIDEIDDAGAPVELQARAGKRTTNARRSSASNSQSPLRTPRSAGRSVVRRPRARSPEKSGSSSRIASIPLPGLRPEAFCSEDPRIRRRSAARASAILRDVRPSARQATRPMASSSVAARARDRAALASENVIFFEPEIVADLVATLRSSASHLIRLRRQQPRWALDRSSHDDAGGRGFYRRRRAAWRLERRPSPDLVIVLGARGAVRARRSRTRTNGPRRVARADCLRSARPSR